MRWAFVLLAWPFAAMAEVSCDDVTFLSQSFTVCEVSSDSQVALYHSRQTGEVLGGFAELQNHVEGKLVFAMNAGMYHDDRSPVGLFRKDQSETTGLVRSAGPGNFGMLPNGVFCIAPDGAMRVYETLAFDAIQPDCRDATQSGPMLVIDGNLHPRFIDGGTSRRIRNGVGALEDGSRAWFAISNEPVNFYDFARLFRDHLGLQQALYFDGNVSRLFADDLNRNDAGVRLGPMIAVIDAEAVAE